MKINQDTIIFSDKLILVPYKESHVPTYHQWMKDPWLQEMTESEPLTLEQEYQNQKEWYLDQNKCTFIVLDRTREGCPMAGDINLFLLRDDDDDNENEDNNEQNQVQVQVQVKKQEQNHSHKDSDQNGGKIQIQTDTQIQTQPKRIGELSVMIAEPASRRKGLAKQAVLTMMYYAHQYLGIHTFIAKIIQSNLPSLSLFETQLGFKLTKHIEAFDELHFKKVIPLRTYAHVHAQSHPHGNLNELQQTWDGSTLLFGSYKDWVIQNENENCK